MTAPAKACLLLLSVAVVAIALFVLFFDKHNELLGYRFLFRSPEQPHVYSSQLPLSPRLSAKDVYNLKISQSRMTEMLRVFDEICVNHSIEYFVIGGTLLGAVAYQDWTPIYHTLKKPSPLFATIFQISGSLMGPQWPPTLVIALLLFMECAA